ncbi:hypothetical protein Tco_0761529 [Tanacetum coccineum]
MDGGDDRDDDDDDSSGDDADDEDEDEEDNEEEEEEHLAPANSAIVVPTVEPISPPEGTEHVIPPSSTDISTTGARITVRLQASISLPPEAEVKRLLAMPTPSPSPPISLSPPFCKGGQTLQGEGSTILVESHHTPTGAPSTSQPPTSSLIIPTTHVAEEAAPMHHDSPNLRVHSLGSDEGSLTLNELTVLYTSLSKKVESLEADLKQTKQTYGDAYTKLIMKVKKLEHKVKSINARRKVRLVISEDEDDLEDPSKQGRKIAQIDEDEGINLVQMGAQTQGRSDCWEIQVKSVYDYPEGFTGPSILITTAESFTTAGEGVITAREIPEEVSIDEPDMDVTLAEALVDLLKNGKKNSPKPKERGIFFQDPKEVARREVISPPVLKISAKDKGNVANGKNNIYKIVTHPYSTVEHTANH